MTTRPPTRPTARTPPDRLRWLLLVLFALLVCARMPEILIKGRFWAEEGRFFFRDAWTMTPLQALLAPVGGYLNLVANLATLSARWLMPLPLAPYLTIAVALLVQLLPPWLLLTARDRWLQPAPVRIAATALLLLVPASEEIWLQTLHCQFELTLCGAIILSLETAPGRAGAARLAILLLAPLCGPGAAALLPLFAVRLLTDRSRARLLQLAALGAGTAIQLLCFLKATPGRSYSLDPAVLMCILTVRHLALPFLGFTQASHYADAVKARLATGHVPHVASILPVLAFGGAWLATLLRPASRPAFWLLSAGLLTASIAYFGAIGQATNLIDVRFGERYAFVPQALFGLALLAAATTTTWRPAALVAWIAVAWLLAAGTVGFLRPWPLIDDGPAWRPEVRAWHADPTHPLRLWPNGWSMILDPAHRAIGY